MRLVAATAAVAVALPLLQAGPSAVADVNAGEGALQAAFAAAAEEHGVPEEVLLGVGYLQSRWDGHRGAPSVAGGYGPMHLTDVRTALAAEPGDNHHLHGDEDPRGDTGRPSDPAHAPEPAAPTAPAPDAERGRTVERAAELTGLRPHRLRSGNAANVQGGAALLAASQRELGLPASEDPADWYAAVAGYGGSDSRPAAEAFADEVFAVIAEGAERTTDDGQHVVLPATEVAPRTGQAALLALPPAGPEGGPAPAEEPAGAAGDRAECPAALSCEWIDAAYEEYERPDGGLTYGNHDKADRPASQRVRYVVVHDMEGYFGPSVDLVQDPTWASWQYSLRASDGHVAQHVPARDVAWHAGNWYVNAASIGLEHEGFLRAPGTWYTEAMYRASARLVAYLAERHGIPLDRHHVIGHDNVPGVGPDNIPGMHTDPGPYWDWAHYFSLLGAPITADGAADSPLVTVAPAYDAHRPGYTGCDPDDTAAPCEPHGSSGVRLHTGPSADAPLVPDPGTHPGREESGTSIHDIGARASTGQQFALAGRDGEWTAIWFNGRRAWFHDPEERPAAVPGSGWVATPKEGVERVPVYGVAYPEASDYPEGVAVRAAEPLPYRFTSGQSYAVGRGGEAFEGEFYSATTFDPADHQVVRGQLYHQIQLGHRIAFVRADDVDVRPAG
ncbi:N-acetylmuramoyl-L-alanine amidase [Streptomyces sp. ventii]|uniref:N-acetylmuramoyl-L-alanine amidase n=1 Tax=Streptomyces spiramenti TaxID=2720606 RepID=A0ABX1AW54_9ACTN|nr:N-acetylmuramoyl-L-alanine amidase [Streptomyces spiramenti]